MMATRCLETDALFVKLIPTPFARCSLLINRSVSYAQKIASNVTIQVAKSA